MNIFISNFTGIEFYLGARSNNYLEILTIRGNNILGANIYTPNLYKYQLTESNVSHNNNLTIRTNDITKSYIPYVDTTKSVDVIVSKSSNQNKTKLVNYHLISGKLPPYSFLKVAKGLYVVCPELLFCQMASVFSPVRLLLFGLELCGTYAMRHEEDNSFMPNVPALTTAERIKKYINSLQKCQAHFRGIAKAKNIAQYLSNNSASPQESKLYVQLCAPRKLGGYGIRNIKFNQNIQLSKAASNIIGYSKIRPDLCNPKTKLVIEYDSTYYHENADQNKHDKLRLDAFHNDG